MAVSADTSEDSRALRERLGLNFPLLSDPDVAVAAAYGVAMRGDDIAIPSTFLIVPSHEIVWSYVGETPADRPSTLRLIEQLDRLSGRD